MEPQRQDIQKLTAALNNLTKELSKMTPQIMRAAVAAQALTEVLKENPGAQEDDQVR